MIGFDNELDRIEFMIFLTERANARGDLDDQIDRLMVQCLSEVSGIPYDELMSDEPPSEAELKRIADEKARIQEKEDLEKINVFTEDTLECKLNKHL